jgi:hypothetical protein
MLINILKKNLITLFAFTFYNNFYCVKPNQLLTYSLSEEEYKTLFQDVEKIINDEKITIQDKKSFNQDQKNINYYNNFLNFLITTTLSTFSILVLSKNYKNFLLDQEERNVVINDDRNTNQLEENNNINVINIINYEDDQLENMNVANDYDEYQDHHNNQNDDINNKLKKLIDEHEAKKNLPDVINTFTPEKFSRFFTELKQYNGSAPLGQLMKIIFQKRKMAKFNDEDKKMLFDLIRFNKIVYQFYSLNLESTDIYDYQSMVRKIKNGENEEFNKFNAILIKYDFPNVIGAIEIQDIHDFLLSDMITLRSINSKEIYFQNLNQQNFIKNLLKNLKVNFRESQEKNKDICSICYDESALRKEMPTLTFLNDKKIKMEFSLNPCKTCESCKLSSNHQSTDIKFVSRNGKTYMFNNMVNNR